MIYGIGVDSIIVERIKNIIDKYGQRFLDKIFTTNEQNYCNRKPHKAEHYAARFAAKEAFGKALGTGVFYKFSWKDVEVTRHESGKPTINYTGYFKDKLKDANILLSLSHTSKEAIAFVIIETK